MPVPILIDEIFGRNLADRSEPLRTPRSHPDEISRRDRIPRIAEPVDSATLEHHEAVLHDMHFDRAQRGAWLVDHCVHGEVETDLIRQQTFDLQTGIASQRMRGDYIFT